MSGDSDTTGDDEHDALALGLAALMPVVRDPLLAFDIAAEAVAASYTAAMSRDERLDSALRACEEQTLEAVASGSVSCKARMARAQTRTASLDAKALAQIARLADRGDLVEHPLVVRTGRRLAGLAGPVRMRDVVPSALVERRANDRWRPGEQDA